MSKTTEITSLRNAKARVLTLAAAAVVLVSALAITVTTKDNKKPQNLARAGTSTNVLGVSTQTQDATIGISKISTNTTDSRTTKGMKRVTVSVSILNTAGKELLIAPGSQMTLVDTQGAAYVMTAGYSPNHVIGGTLQSSQSFTDDIDFEVPVDATPSQFIFQADANSPATTITL